MALAGIDIFIQNDGFCIICKRSARRNSLSKMCHGLNHLQSTGLYNRNKVEELAATCILSEEEGLISPVHREYIVKKLFTSLTC